MSCKYYEGGSYRTSSGRTSKPTEKAKSTLNESYIRAFTDGLQDIRDLEAQIRVSMAGRRPQETVLQEYEHHIDLCAQLQDLVRTIKGHVEAQVHKEFLMDLKTLQPLNDTLQRDVHAYCESHNSRKQSSPVKVEPEEVGCETERLEREIEELQQELDSSWRTWEKRNSDLRSMPQQGDPIVSDQPYQYGIMDRLNKGSTLKTERVAEEEEGNIGRETKEKEVDRSGPGGDPHLLIRLLDMIEGRDDTRHLPKAEPDMFKSNVLQFSKWWSSFEALVEGPVTCPKRRLHYLLQYTEGEPHDAIELYSHLHASEDSYDLAKQELFQRYGDQLQIAEAYKQKLHRWNKVKDGDAKGLLRFADFLLQCDAAKSSVRGLDILDTQEENVKLAAKLPNHVVTKWSRKVHKMLYPEGKGLTLLSTKAQYNFPRLRQFAEFVREEAMIMNSPYFMKPPPPDPPPPPQLPLRKIQAYQSTAQPTPPPAPPATDDKRKPRCSFCKQEHYLYQCSEFSGLPRERKIRYARDRGLCFGCLRRGHRADECYLQTQAIPKRGEPNLTSTSYQTGTGTGAAPYCMIMPVKISVDDQGSKEMEVYALVDSQSDSCFVADWVVNQLQADAEPCTLDLITLGKKSTVKSSIVKGLAVKGTRNTIFRAPECYSRPELPHSEDSIPDPEVVRAWPHLRDIADEISPKKPGLKVGILLGNNCTPAMKPFKTRVTRKADIFAVQTDLGWMVTGYPDSRRSDARKVYSYTTSAKICSIDDIRRAFDVGFEEPMEGPEKKMSADDLRFMDIMEKGVRRNDQGKIELPLPMKEIPDELPDLRADALRLFESTRRRKKKNPVYWTKYCNFMDKLINSGQAEEVPFDKLSKRAKAWYWSHHGVENENKPDVVRVIFNGSRQIVGICINDYLLTGPDQLNSLIGVLCRFREELVPFTCDVEGMFHQVMVTEDFRDFLRFFWLNPEDPDGPPKEYRMTVHLFGASSSPGCANFALCETARLGEGKFGKEAANFVRENFYVADGLGSQPTNEKAIELIRNAKGLCAEGGFNLHKFTCPEAEVLKSLPDTWVATDISTLDPGDERTPKERALGVQILLKEDALMYEVKLLDKPMTRRGCLSALSAFYDPLGLISPALLPGRILLQDLCSRKLSWDEAIDLVNAEAWRSWYGELQELGKLKIVRCVKRDLEGRIIREELHIYADASLQGYGVCCYLRLVTDRNTEKVMLMVAKSRVAPVKCPTIPRLELQAAVLAVKTGNTLKAELRYKNLVVYYWSDSMVVLGYIFNELRKFLMYVANRTQFIRRYTDKGQWRYISTHSNPADLASRGVRPRELRDLELWWRGPENIGDLLKEDPVPRVVELPNDPEVKKEVQVKAVKTQPKPWILSVSEKYEKWEVAISVLALLRLPFEIKKRSRLTLVQLKREMEKQVVRATQRYYMETEVKGVLQAMANSKYQPKFSHKNTQVQGLDPFIDAEGLLRVGGRMKYNEVICTEVQPMVILQESKAACQIIADAHYAQAHLGTGPTLSEIRAKGYWIVHARAMIGKHIHRCSTCKRFKGSPCRPKMGELPWERTTPTPPFENSATDVFGPF